MVRCTICYTDDLHEVGEIDCCDHRFCCDCIQQWAERENKCPVCKRRFHTIKRKALSQQQGQEQGQQLVQSSPAKRRRKSPAPTDAAAGSSPQHQQQEQEPPASPKGPLPWRVVDTIVVDDKDQAYNPEEFDAALLAALRCQVCGGDDDDEHLLICDGCEQGYHTHCVHLDVVPGGDWYCPACMQLPHIQVYLQEATLEELRRAGRTQQRRQQQQQLRGGRRPPGSGGHPGDAIDLMEADESSSFISYDSEGDSAGTDLEDSEEVVGAAAELQAWRQQQQQQRRAASRAGDRVDNAMAAAAGAAGAIARGGAGLSRRAFMGSLAGAGPSWGETSDGPRTAAPPPALAQLQAQGRALPTIARTARAGTYQQEWQRLRQEEQPLLAGAPPAGRARSSSGAQAVPPAAFHTTASEEEASESDQVLQQAWRNLEEAKARVARGPPPPRSAAASTSRTNRGEGRAAGATSRSMGLRGASGVPRSEEVLRERVLARQQQQQQQGGRRRLVSNAHSDRAAAGPGAASVPAGRVLVGRQGRPLTSFGGGLDEDEDEQGPLSFADQMRSTVSAARDTGEVARRNRVALLQQQAQQAQRQQRLQQLLRQGRAGEGGGTSYSSSFSRAQGAAATAAAAAGRGGSGGRGSGASNAQQRSSAAVVQYAAAQEVRSMREEQPGSRARTLAELKQLAHPSRGVGPPADEENHAPLAASPAIAAAVASSGDGGGGGHGVRQQRPQQQQQGHHDHQQQPPPPEQQRQHQQRPPPPEQQQQQQGSRQWQAAPWRATAAAVAAAAAAVAGATCATELDSWHPGSSCGTRLDAPCSGQSATQFHYQHQYHEQQPQQQQRQPNHEQQQQQQPQQQQHQQHHEQQQQRRPQHRHDEQLQPPSSQQQQQQHGEQQPQQRQLSAAQLKAAKGAAVQLVKHALTNPYNIGRITKQQFTDLAKAAGRGMYQRCKTGQLRLSQLEAAEQLSPEGLQQALLHHGVAGMAAAAGGSCAPGLVNGAAAGEGDVGLHAVLEALQEEVNAAGAADVALV